MTTIDGRPIDLGDPAGPPSTRLEQAEKAGSEATRAVPLPIFDAHFHVIDPAFPLVPNHSYLPKPFAAVEYLDQVSGLGVRGGAVVSASFQGYDQLYLLAALERLGPGFVGVTQLPHNVSDRSILNLDRGGVRALRFNFVRGPIGDLKQLAEFGHRVSRLCGWHVEMYVDAQHLPLLGAIRADSITLVVDHLGLTKSGLPALLRHVDDGGFVKASGFGRLDFDPAEALVAITRRNPRALVFGTDLPSTRAHRPFLPEDLRMVVDSLGPGLASQVLWANAVELYRLAR